MRKLLVIIMCCCFASVWPTLAQDKNEAKCDLASLQKLIDTYIETLQTVKAKETDPDTILNDLQLIANIANSQRAACDGLSFSGTGQQLVGPVTIPAGFYRARATTDDFMIVKVSSIDGECGAGSRSVGEHLFGIKGGEATKGMEALFSSKGCSAMIEVSLVSDRWKLEFERISTK
jgi:hypothetical protein